MDDSVVTTLAKSLARGQLRFSLQRCDWWARFHADGERVKLHARFTRQLLRRRSAHRICKFHAAYCPGRCFRTRPAILLFRTGASFSHQSAARRWHVRGIALHFSQSCSGYQFHFSIAGARRTGAASLVEPCSQSAGTTTTTSFAGQQRKSPGSIGLSAAPPDAIHGMELRPQDGARVSEAFRATAPWHGSSFSELHHQVGFTESKVSRRTGRDLRRTGNFAWIRFAQDSTRRFHPD